MVTEGNWPKGTNDILYNSEVNSFVPCIGSFSSNFNSNTLWEYFSFPIDGVGPTISYSAGSLYLYTTLTTYNNVFVAPLLARKRDNFTFIGSLSAAQEAGTRQNIGIALFPNAFATNYNNDDTRATNLFQQNYVSFYGDLTTNFLYFSNTGTVTWSGAQALVPNTTYVFKLAKAGSAYTLTFNGTGKGTYYVSGAYFDSPYKIYMGAAYMDAGTAIGSNFAIWGVGYA